MTLDLKQHLIRQMAFSRATFGPGTRTEGVLDHLQKEIEEVRESNGSVDEWVDLVILSLDGLTRQLAFCANNETRIWTSEQVAEDACLAIVKKQDRNENRVWPDWRTAPKDRAIEHDRSATDGD